MRRWAACFFALSCWVPPALGQASVYVSGGLGFPFGPDTFKELWNPGWGAGSGVTVALPFIKGIELTASVQYNRFPLDENAAQGSLEAEEVLSGGDASILGVNGAIRLHLQDTGARPYALLGGGYYRLRADDLAVASGGKRVTARFDPNSGIGLLSGAGVLYPVGTSLELFAEFRAVYMLDEGADELFFPLRVGIALTMGR